MKSIIIKKKKKEKKKQTRRSFGGRREEMFSFHPRGGVAGMDWRGSDGPTEVEVEATHESNSGLSVLCTTLSLALLAPVYGARGCSRVSFRRARRVRW